MTAEVTIAQAIQEVVEGHDLSAESMRSAMSEILDGSATPVQIAALSVALRMKGESVSELASAAAVLRAQCDPVRIDTARLLDTCGTGGDGAGTFNVSTVTAIVVAACGVPVAKHGNRAVSSRAGSADVLEALGLRLDLPAADLALCLREVGITFLYAPQHHQALKHAASVRRELALRTFFNLLGPLANPAGATHQLVGVFAPERVRQVAEALGMLGTRRAWVVHGEGGLDEVSPSGTTRVAMLDNGRVEEASLEPSDFGIEPVDLEELAGGDAAHNASIAQELFAGARGARRQMVLVNAAAALCVAGETQSVRDGVARAATALDSGAAQRLLATWIAWTQARRST